MWVNGHHLGRYWSDQGPQESLYVPGVWLVRGDNEVVLLELDGELPEDAGGGGGLTVRCVASPDFSGPPGGPAPFVMA